MIKLLFLGYTKKETRLIDFLRSNKKIQLTSYSKKVTSKYLKRFNFIVCFGYRHIIEQSVIKEIKSPIINLHIGYLPYNRGSYPNFWSFVENTPSGVTIHKVEQGVDSGKIIFQKLVDFNLLENRNKLTFSNTYEVLINEIENLFISKFDKLISNNYRVFEQIGEGSIHKKSDLPKLLKNWNQNVYKTVIKFQLDQKNKMKRNLDITDQIESARKSNNINWMNLIRTSLKSSSDETLKILREINSDDNKISSLFKKFNNEK